MQLTSHLQLPVFVVEPSLLRALKDNGSSLLAWNLVERDVITFGVVMSEHSQSVSELRFPLCCRVTRFFTDNVSLVAAGSIMTGIRKIRSPDTVSRYDECHRYISLFPFVSLDKGRDAL